MHIINQEDLHFNKLLNSMHNKTYVNFEQYEKIKYNNPI